MEAALSMLLGNTAIAVAILRRRHPDRGGRPGYCYRVWYSRRSLPRRSRSPAGNDSDPAGQDRPCRSRCSSLPVCSTRWPWSASVSRCSCCLRTPSSPSSRV